MSTKRRALIAAIALVLAGLENSGAVAQQQEKLPDFAPLLPDIRAKTNTVDPQKGYLVRELKPNVFMITDGGYESAFVTTGRGVVLFDAPPSFAHHIVQAVNEVTREPIVELVYSHLHLDHIGGAGIISRRFPNSRSWPRREQRGFCASYRIRSDRFRHGFSKPMKHSKSVP